MSRVEDLAKELFPNWKTLGVPNVDGQEESMVRIQRVAYIKGYHQAEKDLELTLEDIRIILDAENDILRECNSHKELVIETYPKGEDYYGEILKRFKNLKK